VGGEADTFHRLQQAYEMLVGEGASGPPVTAPGRPSRPRDEWSSAQGGVGQEQVDLDAVPWDLSVPEPGAGLSRDVVACWLASGDTEPVRALTATSRAPGSRLNRLAPNLSVDLTASLEIGPATDDRGRVVVVTHVRASNRRGRRVLDEIGLDGGWVRRRGTASTTLRRATAPDRRPRVTALRTADAVAELLDRAAWPLESWVLTDSEHA
jgi:hypothetical protein